MVAVRVIVQFLTLGGHLHIIWGLAVVREVAEALFHLDLVELYLLKKHEYFSLITLFLYIEFLDLSPQLLLDLLNRVYLRLNVPNIGPLLRQSLHLLLKFPLLKCQLLLQLLYLLPLQLRLLLIGLEVLLDFSV